MVYPGSVIYVPSVEQIVRLNRQTILAHGGEYIEPDNFQNESSLSWVLDAIQHPLYNQQLYPSLEQKAAILVWTIIDAHVFIDGCKRTAAMTAFNFLEANGYEVITTSESIISLCFHIADKSILTFQFSDVVNWFSSTIKPTSSPAHPALP